MGRISSVKFKSPLAPVSMDGVTVLVLGDSILPRDSATPSSSGGGILIQNLCNVKESNPESVGWDWQGAVDVDGATNTPNPSNAAKVTFASGFGGGNAPGKIVTAAFTSQTNIYYGFWIKYDPNWTRHDIGEKQLYIWWGSAENLYFGPEGPSGFCGTDKMTASIQTTWQEGEHNICANVSNPSLLDNTWYWIEMHLVMNTVGQANGIMQLWVTPQGQSEILVMDYSNKTYRNDSSHQFNRGEWIPIWGGSGGTKPAEEYLWYDKLTIATQKQGS